MGQRELPAKDRSIANAVFDGAANTREVEYRIAGNPGLVLIVHRPDTRGRSSRSWRAHYSLTTSAGRIRRRVLLGRYPAVSFSSARAQAADIMAAVENGSDPVATAKVQEVAVARQSLTLCDLVEEYLADRADLSSIDEIARELRKDVLPTLGNRPPASLTSADIDTVASAVLFRGAAGMARRVITNVKTIFNYALLDSPRLAEKYGLTHNPAERLGRRRRGGSDRYAASKPRQRVMTDAEIETWWRVLSTSGMRADTSLLLRLVLATGQRPGEVRRARHRDLQLGGNDHTWTIPEVHAKNRREHVVPLSAFAVTLFRQTIELAPSRVILFPAPDDVEDPIGNVVAPSAMSNLFAIHLKGAVPATVHDLRRSAATGMRRIGVASDVVGMVLNHARQDVTGRHYDHHDGFAEKRDALVRWGAHLTGLVIH